MTKAKERTKIVKTSQYITLDNLDLTNSFSCNKAFLSESSVVLLGCSPKKLFSCQLCGKVLCSKASLKRHIADKHAERQEEYRCIICERVYCSRNSLMTHIYTYHKSRPGEMEMKDIKFF
ncbi:broad-complex core-protein [Culex quinquefasciatus]|uniref:Broad-complex core-protein n=1 Tax=Culex quinquefasciatus TaxID=7176 RepID=B0W8G2_CULQU|nr:broad-complex core-protein [Culex quinquefasciatus]|eukprot:XP_001844996.1 broad-complex core-protein [Culex quinquefasciatus]